MPLPSQVGNKFHVHTDPVPASGECGALATGGHFDPAGANYSSGNVRPAQPCHSSPLALISYHNPNPNSGASAVRVR